MRGLESMFVGSQTRETPEECSDQHCRWAALPKHSQEKHCIEEHCKHYRGSTGNSSVATYVAYDIYNLHLVSLGGKKLVGLSDPYYAAIGQLRMKLIENITRSLINEALSKAFGGTKKNG